MNSLPTPGSSRLTTVHWLICIIASIGFAFDTYELLMMPLAGPPALAEMLGVDPITPAGSEAIKNWVSAITWSSAICGGVFGLLGGYLTDRLGRRRVLTWSILLYACSSAASAFVTSAWMLLVLRCTTFIGVCVEFVAAVAWLSELFPQPKSREAVLGLTQAFGSTGGLLVAGMYHLIQDHAASLPAWPTAHGASTAWRYTLISGLIPALPLILIRPFLPESPEWKAKKAAGTLKRPRLGEIFGAPFRRTTVVTTVLFACAFGAAFGGLQLTSQMVPGLLPESKQLSELRGKIVNLEKDEAKKGNSEFEKTEAFAALKKQMVPLVKVQQTTVADVTIYQEIGGLVGRFILAVLALLIVRRGALLRNLQIPGLILIPLVFFYPAAGNMGEQSLEMLKWGIFLAGLFTVAQFSFFGNYLPRMYPMHLRGTGESFAANVGGRMIGTAAQPLATSLVPLLLPMIAAVKGPKQIAYSAGVVVLLVYAVGLIASFWLPEPTVENLPD